MKRLATAPVLALLIIGAFQWTVAQTVGGPWWNTQWHYRLPVAAGANGYVRTDKVANFSVNFTTLLTSLGASGAMNDQSIRVVEVNGGGTVIDSNVVYQFDRDPAYNANTNALGTVAVMVSGTTSGGTTRYYHIYFDTGAGFSLPSFTNQLTLTDNVFFEGQMSYQIDNQLGRLWYHKVGGGFAGMRDLNNVEWIGYTPCCQGAGEFRGIPNMGPYAHPGYSNGSSTILSQGPIKITIQTVTTDGSNGRWIWEFYPTYQTMTLQQTSVNYWLLYEGIPAGTLDGTNGYIKISNGQTLNLGSSFAYDLPGPEWAYFGMSGQPRFLYLVHHEDDNLIDHYRPFPGPMTVYGFGRDGSSVNHYMSATPQRLTFGMGENESQSAETMDNAFRDLAIAYGAAEQNVSGPAQITSHPTDKTVQAGQTATFTVTAVGTPVLTYQWQRNTVDLSGATSYSYTTPVTTTADSGASFRCIVNNGLGTVTSNGALLHVTPGPPPPSSTIKTDEFNAGQLDLYTWQYKDPVGDATRSMTGTQLSLSVPAGVSHDIYTGQNRSPRVVQNITNILSFDVKAKFDSPMNAQYQIEGIVVEQDSLNLLRFAFYTDGASTYIDAYSITNNVAFNRISSAIGGISLSPLYMRLLRATDTWTLSYSFNDTAWTEAGNFNHVLTASAIGPFAGNAGGSPPAFTCLVDFFHNLNELPIQLGSFTARLQSENRVRLDWVTVSETNNYGFEVQKAFGSANNYQTIPNSFIPGNGTTLEPHHYSFIDVITENGAWYYRLKQIDLDGTVSYTEPVLVSSVTGVSGSRLPTKFAVTQNYPNPFNPSTTIRYELPQDAHVSLVISDVLGREITTLVNETKSAGYYAAEWNALSAASGIYFARFTVMDATGAVKYAKINKLLLMK